MQDAYSPFSARGFKRLLLGSTCLLVLAGATFIGEAQARSLVPEQPSVEVNLDALERLRPQPFMTPTGKPIGGGPRKSIVNAAPEVPRQRPMQQPVATARMAPVYNPPVAAAAPVASAPIPYTPPAQPMTVDQTVAAASMPMLPPPPAPLNASQMPVQQAAAQPLPSHVPTEVVKPIAPSAEPLPQIAATAPATNYVDLSKPGTAVPQTTQAVVPHVPPPSVAAQPMVASLDQAATQAPQVPQKKMKKSAKAYPKLEPLPEPQPQMASAAAAPTVTSAPTPVPAVNPTALAVPPIAALAPVQATTPVASTAATAAVLPPAPPPQTMVVNPKPLAPVAVAAPPAKVAAVAPAPDNTFKNLNDRANSIFMKEPAKQGIVSDTTQRVNPLDLPKPQSAAAVQANLAPLPTIPLVPVKPIEAAPAPVATSNSAVDKLAMGAKAAPSIPVPPAPVTHDRDIVEKPKQMSLAQLDKVAPVDSMRTQPDILPPAPVEKKTPERQVASAAQAVKKEEPKKVEAAAPKIAAVPPVMPPTDEKPVLLPPPTLVPVKTDVKPSLLPALPDDTVKPADAKVASQNDIDSLLPKPGAAPAKAADKPVVTPPVKAEGGLPSLDAITGEKAATKLASNDVAPVKPSDLPVVKRGVPGSSAKEQVALVTPPEVAAKPVPPVVPVAPVKADEAKPTILPALPSVADESDKTNTASTEQPKPASVARSSSGGSGLDKPKMSVNFQKDKSDVDPDMQTKLNGLAKDVKSDGNSVRIVAYASGAEADASAARRVSLSRALQIRAKLIEQGVDPMKITVQALGNTVNTDKADIVVK